MSNAGSKDKSLPQIMSAERVLPKPLRRFGSSPTNTLTWLFVLRAISAFSVLSKPRLSKDCPLKSSWVRSLCRLDAHRGWNDTRPQDIQSPRPIPTMPSQLFQRMALSQLELLAHSLSEPGKPITSSKVESMALYLPQENLKTGQLEFLPIVLYPDPTTERVFIASNAGSGVAPTLPKTLTILPGFAHAATLLPGYPMISSSSEPGVGVIEEVMCDARSKNKAAALSVPLLSGPRTVGVLLVSPSVNSKLTGEHFWTDFDKQQVFRAAQSLSMALSMDNERNILQAQNSAFREGLSDSLHQVKNPLQALRTYGKLLQRQIVNAQTDRDRIGMTPQLLELTESLLTQSERVIDLLVPMDSLIDTLETTKKPLYLNPAKNDTGSRSLVLWQEQSHFLPWETETLEFARDNSTIMEFTSHDPNFRNEEVEYQVESTGRSSAPSPCGIPSTVVGDLDLEMTFVSDLLEPIFAAFSAIGMERGIKFEVVQDSEELPGVIAAPRSLQEAVCNVIDNA